MEVEQKQEIADKPNHDGLTNLEHVVVCRINADRDKKQRARIEVLVGNGRGRTGNPQQLEIQDQGLALVPAQPAPGTTEAFVRRRSRLVRIRREQRCARAGAALFARHVAARPTSLSGSPSSAFWTPVFRGVLTRFLALAMDLSPFMVGVRVGRVFQHLLGSLFYDTIKP
jgi:hypothetical protein